MKTAQRPVTLESLLAALADTAGVHALAGKDSDHWSTVVGWQPKAELNLSAQTPDWPDQLRAFVSEHAGSQCIGYVSYEAGRSLHGLPARSAQLPLPDIHVAAFSNYVTFDDTVMAVHYQDESFLDTVDALLNTPVARSTDATYESPLQSNITEADYQKAFELCQKYIKNGDVYQLNLTHQLTGRSSLGGVELFLRLYAASSAGQLGFVNMSEVDVISGSPERFIQTRGREIQTQPIKGTRPRGNTPEEDKHLRQALVDSPKEQAELAMITDLLRNDLGKVCAVGSVELREARTVTEHASIWHTHSVIAGQLADGIEPVDALMSMSPGGSITGCPKKRAMEIIDELETVPRGLYTGSIFRIDSNGDLDSSIVIRTALKHGSDMYVSVGGGIVYDSAADAEYLESLNKSKLWQEL